MIPIIGLICATAGAARVTQDCLNRISDGCTSTTAKSIAIVGNMVITAAACFLLAVFAYSLIHADIKASAAFSEAARATR